MALLYSGPPLPLPVTPRQVLLLFVDGLGLGPQDPVTNPLAAARTPSLDALVGRRLAGITERVEHSGALLIPTDATLGVAGLPQSATGQTALLTGVNASQLVGRHVTAYPTAQLRAVLTERNLFAQVKAIGGTVALANAYTDEYFKAVEEGRLRHAAITFSALAAGVPLRRLEDLRAGRAVFHDLTNARVRSWGHDVPAITPRQAGENLAGIASEYHLTVFEFFLTDLAAHGRVPQQPVQVIEMLDGVVAGVVERADLARMLVALVSDHGNIEDSRTTHTRNPVPTLLIGSGRQEVGERIRAITDIAPALVDWLAGGLGHG
jgi:2,3-bisphosphoglycerate-independent phosphoglycerate mutase